MASPSKMNELMAKVASLEAENAKLRNELTEVKRTLAAIRKASKPTPAIEAAVIAAAEAEMRVASQEAARAILDDVKGIV